MSIVSHVEALGPIVDESRTIPSAADRGQILLARIWRPFQWMLQRVTVKQARKNLKVCENISLGEKRFVAVIQVDEERFLIGGSSSSVSLLTRLQEQKSGSTDLEREAGKNS
jgi:flagellar biogenesis protein FliO